MTGDLSLIQKPQDGAEENFVRIINALPAVLPIKMDNLPVLRRVFDDAAFEDSYAESPVYHGLTGRRGLWIYAHDKSAFLFCLHPNLRDKVLVFPLLAKKNPDVVSTFINAVVPSSGMDVMLARVPPEEEATSRRVGQHLFRPQREEVLDWAWPVHTVSLAALAQRRGGAYSVIRQTMNKFADSDLRERPINFQQDAGIVARLAQEWEKSRSDYFSSYQMPSTYYARLLELGREGANDLHGLLVTDNDRPVGFSIWENGMKGTANLFASAVSGDNRTNLCTWLIVRSCEAARKAGMSRMCLGGSETAGMDRFKRKFVPSQSLSLSTMVLAPS